MTNVRRQLWLKAVEFHGHSCPGLAVGVRVALDCREEMDLTSRAKDEEIVAVAETDACGVDGIQSILGCTVGKGNLLVNRRGKNVFTIYRRSDGCGLRYCWKSRGLDGMTPQARTELFLEAPQEEVYTVTPARYPLPPRASIYPSVFCDCCGERTAEPWLTVRNGQMICLDCAGKPFDFSGRAAV
ncbi:MAG: FmdE family protein [Deltaproteobacteria bacterium]|nr:FmdE family protein [Deltaproteobacteria bacterium]